jgi:Na+-translocating ferredoxin:NAD+ oxidoreductase RnfA subunit
MDSVKDMLLLLISSSIVSNIVLSQFMGLCPFLGVSRKIKTAGGMGTAVIFVITLASAVAGVIYKFILQPLHIEYLETIVFILVIAALVQFVEMFLKKAMPSLYQALGSVITKITAVPMPPAVLILRDTPKKGHSPMNWLNTILLTMEELISNRSISFTLSIYLSSLSKSMVSRSSSAV